MGVDNAFRDKSKKILQNKGFDGGIADAINFITLPKTTNADLANLVDKESSLVYNTDTQSIMINDGSGSYVDIGGGGGTPSGSNGNLQYNDSGAFAGTDNLSYDDVNQSLFLEGASGSTVHTLKLKSDYQQINLDHNYQSDPNARAWCLNTNNPNSGELALFISPDELTDPSVRVWSLDNNHEMFMWQNDKWFYQRNAADNGFVGMLKVDASNNIQIQDSPTNITLDGTNGNITIAADTSIQLQDGTQGTIGHVWTSTDTDGSGSWQPGGGSAPTGNVNTSAYFDAAGNLSSDNGSLFDETKMSRADVLASGGGSFSATGIGAYTHGQAQGNGLLLANGAGGLTSGSVNTSGIINAGGVGSVASGQALSGGIVSAAGDGASVSGAVIASGSFLAADGLGSHVSGYIDGSGVVLTTSGQGAMAFGYATNGNIAGSGHGSIIGGGSLAGVHTSSGVYSMSVGDAHTLTADLGQTFGLGNANSSYASMAIGRYADDVGTPGSWVATEPLFVAGNGTGSGSEANALRLDKDGKITNTGAVVNTAIRIASTTTSVSARTDRKILLDDQTAGANTLNLPAGEDGLTFTFSAVNTNTGTWAVSPNGGDLVDGNLPPDVSSSTVPKNITFLGGTWYYI